eukprot:CAMPEP_0182471950 /NCGR_PEP_ID=MMETSP1319-20130603/21290_1 /TAXON_ID=172717 /ORGANISM="Bolidomonas pacifica, Strain RCC208" /LENGTH=59 /DNA_ID=CAMNT_0024672563 /DNA_START=154 /DNA_END=330 /DNA_ORIENTATION=+
MSSYVPSPPIQLSRGYSSPKRTRPSGTTPPSVHRSTFYASSPPRPIPGCTGVDVDEDDD